MAVHCSVFTGHLSHGARSTSRYRREGVFAYSASGLVAFCAVAASFHRVDRPASKPNQWIEPMTRSAITLLLQPGAPGALLIMAHPFR